MAACRWVVPGARSTGGDPSENLQSPVHAPQSLAIAHLDTESQGTRRERVLRRIEWIGSVNPAYSLVAAVLPVTHARVPWRRTSSPKRSTVRATRPVWSTADALPRR